MSTEIETKMQDHTLTRFWGGDHRGRCVQITVNKLKIADSVDRQLQNEGFIHLTMEEAAALCNALAGFICEEAVRRQDLLRKQIEGLQEMEHTVFREVVQLPHELFTVPVTAVDMVAKFCPKTSREAAGE